MCLINTVVFSIHPLASNPCTFHHPLRYLSFLCLLLQGCVLFYSFVSLLTKCLCLCCSPSWQISQVYTSTLLYFLSGQGNRVSLSKVQLSTPYLGLTITTIHNGINLDRKCPIQSLSVTTTNDKILSFPGVAGFLCSWIPSFFLVAHLIYQVLLGPQHQSLLAPISKSFQKFQQALLWAFALYLPDLPYPFFLCYREGGICL